MFVEVSEFDSTSVFQYPCKCFESSNSYTKEENKVQTFGRRFFKPSGEGGSSLALGGSKHTSSRSKGVCILEGSASFICQGGIHQACGI